MLLFSFSKKENTVTYYFLGGAREYRWEGQRGGKVFSFLFSSIRFCWNNLRNMIQFELSFCTGFFLEFFGGILLFSCQIVNILFLFCFFIKFAGISHPKATNSFLNLYIIMIITLIIYSHLKGTDWNSFLGKINYHEMFFVPNLKNFNLLFAHYRLWMLIFFIII